MLYKSVVILLIFHSLNFFLEYIYQTYCFNISPMGFIYSLFSSENNYCTLIRTYKHHYNENIFKIFKSLLIDIKNIYI
jgi:hypothetical protein